MINSGSDRWSSQKVSRPGNHQEVECVKVKAARSRGAADARKGTRAVFRGHWLPGQGLGEGDPLGYREHVAPETFKRT